MFRVTTQISILPSPPQRKLFSLPGDFTVPYVQMAQTNLPTYVQSVSAISLFLSSFPASKVVSKSTWQGCVSAQAVCLFRRRPIGWENVRPPRVNKLLFCSTPARHFFPSLVSHAGTHPPTYSSQGDEP